MGAACLLALDFGGTKHTAGVISTAGQPASPGQSLRAWRAHERVFSPPGADARYDIQAMFDLAHRLLGSDSPAATGASFGGPVEAETGRVRLSHHVPGWENIPLARMLEEEFGAPAKVDNDANVAALGEYRYGAGQGFDSVFYITVSTGVGGGWILDGKPWRGADHMAGEIGHTVVDPSGPVCLCGKRGCVERLASGPYMAQIAREMLLNEVDRADPQRGQILLSLAEGDPDRITGSLLSQAAAQRDEIARSVLERGAWALGVGIGNAANLVNPGCFLLGGGVTKAGPLFWDTVLRVARETALPQVHFEILPAALGDDAPLWGAVALAEDCLR